MKLSEAILLGAEMAPETIEDYGFINAQGITCTCALGAAFHAITGQPPRPSFTQNDAELRKAIRDETGRDLNWSTAPGLASTVFPDSEFNGLYPSLKGTIIHMNDELGWTREKIAATLSRYGL